MFLSKKIDNESENGTSPLELDDANEFSPNFPQKNFVHEMNTLVKKCKSGKTTKNQIALQLNQNMQRKLAEIRTELEVMLNKCNEKYEKNTNYLNKIQLQQNKQTKVFSRQTYNYCGIPYFKDLRGYSAPPNADYINRCDKFKELFPVDIIKKSTFWTLNDKIAILGEIKTQAVDYLQQKKKIIASNLKNTRSRNFRITDENTKYEQMTLSDLLDSVDIENFDINWYRVSLNLDLRHSEISCEAMWNMYLHPKLKRSQWTANEDKLLLKVAKNNHFQNWLKISEHIVNRSEFQCFIRYSTMISEINKKSQKWTKEEDLLLIQAVDYARMNNKKICWNLVHQYLPKRDKKSIITRYSYSLDPNIVKGNFTPEEDCIIIGAVQEYGENFSLIPMSLFPGRTSVQIRNRYRNTLKYVNKHQHWSIEDDKKLMEWVKENGTNKWSELAQIFGYHNRSSVRQRHGTILKFLKKHPDANLSSIPRKSRKQKTIISKDNWVENFNELKKQPSIAVKSNKLKYISKLRSLEKAYYHFFKYSYNFDFTNRISISDLPIKDLNPFLSLFDLNLTSKTISTLPRNGLNKTDLEYLNEIILKYSQNKLSNNINKISFLGANLSTLITLRAISIQCATTTCTAELIKISDIPQANNTNNLAVKDAKEKFKQRFRKLFYKTLVMTRLKVLKKKSPKVNISIKLDLKKILTKNNKQNLTYEVINIKKSPSSSKKLASNSKKSPSDSKALEVKKAISSIKAYEDSKLNLIKSKLNLKDTKLNLKNSKLNLRKTALTKNFKRKRLLNVSDTIVPNKVVKITKS